MQKKTKLLLLVVTHLLCIILGYFIAKTLLDTTGTEITTEIAQELTEDQESQADSTQESSEEPITTKENTFPSGETQAPVPTEQAPAYSQPEPIQPSTTESILPPTEVPDIDVGANGTPIL